VVSRDSPRIYKRRATALFLIFVVACGRHVGAYTRGVLYYVNDITELVGIIHHVYTLQRVYHTQQRKSKIAPWPVAYIFAVNRATPQLSIPRSARNCT